METTSTLSQIHLEDDLLFFNEQEKIDISVNKNINYEENNIQLSAINNEYFDEVKSYMLELKNHIINKTIEINGELFDIEIEEKTFVLTHPQWSIIGTGNTLYDAILDLINEAKTILKNYISVPITEMNEDAIYFREFLFRLV